MRIEYHKPNTYERRRRANFWLSTGSFLASTAVSYLVLLVGLAIATITLVIILANK